MMYKLGNPISLSLSVFLLVLTAEVQASFKIRSASMGGTAYLYLRDIARYYGMTYHPSEKNVQLRSQYSQLHFVVDRRDAVLNGVKVHLSMAPWLRNGEVLLSEPDFRLLLDPIMRARALPKFRPQRIMIDAGHGGRDRGTRGRYVIEKDLVLEIAKRLADALRAEGYTVALTRDGDSALSLGQRPAAAAKWQADLFISLHANYAANSKVKGIETFLLSPVNTASTYSNSTGSTFNTGNHFDKLNARLAFDIQQQAVAATGAVDRGIKRARFAVLKEAPCAAVLIEVGFLSNPQEERLLNSSAYQARLVDGILAGIVRFHRRCLEGS